MPRNSVARVFKTSFAELNYRPVLTNCWRFVDADTNSVIGPQYRTKAELLADLPRFAYTFGVGPQPSPQEHPQVMDHLLTQELPAIDPETPSIKRPRQWTEDQIREAISWAFTGMTFSKNVADLVVSRLRAQ